MKKQILFFGLIVIFFIPLLANAELQYYLTPAGEDPVVYDDVAGLAWMKDMSENSNFYDKDYNDQVQVISDMNTLGNEFHGLAGWHMATESELEELVKNPLSDIAALFDLKWIGGAGEGRYIAWGRYENNVNPPNIPVVNRMICLVTE